jgi:2-methylcitrate dehydratase
VPLLFGHLLASDYEDGFAADPRIDALREKMQCREESAFTADYHDPQKRSIANALTLSLRDGTTMTETVEYPLGHRRRRSEGIPLLEQKFRTNLARRFPPQRQQSILAVSLDQQTLEAMPVQAYVDLYVS